MLRRTSLLLLFLGSFGIAVALKAQTDQTPSEPLPAASFRTTVSTVVLDVVVTDHDGNPVRGLTKDRFQVFEDGKPQTVNFFEPHVEDAPGPLATRPQEPPGIYTNIPATKVIGSVAVLLVDSLNTELVDQAYVRRELLKFIQTLPPGTRIAIFTLSSRLRLLQGFTSDASQLQAALASKAGKALMQNPALLVSPEETSVENQLTQMYQQAITDVAQAGPSAGEAGLQSQLLALQGFLTESHTFQTDYRILTTIEAMQTIARYLAVFPGRKNLIWLSGAFPLAIAPSPSGESATLLPGAQSALTGSSTYNRDYGDALRKTANLLTKAEIAVYPVDARGANVNTMFQASVSSDFMNDGTKPITQVGGDQVQRFEQQQAASQITMDTLAQETGGESFYNSNGITEAMNRVIRLGSSYYSLAYSPTNKDADGKFHKIDIKLDGGKYKMYYHHSYFADQAPAPVQDKTPDQAFRIAMVRGLPVATQIVFKVRVVPADPQPQPGSIAGDNEKLKSPFKRYSLDYSVELRDFQLSQMPDGIRRGTVIVSAIAYDKDGDRLNSFGRSIPFNLDSAAYNLYFESRLEDS
jgi:VWFA-related protein